MKIRIATRKSALALWQAQHVAAILDTFPEISSTELLPLSTRGDEILDRSLQKIGGKGLFIKELEVAMQSGEADLAVHSMKDMPAEIPAGFCLAATLQRANPRDALVSAGHKLLQDLPHAARVGSSSLRRRAQLKILRSDLCVTPLRGNVNTRLQKLENGEYDAIILAAAGLERLELEHHISYPFPPEEMLPAAGQGVLGIECLANNAELRALLSRLDHAATVQTTTAERAVARVLGASCQSPVAAYAEVDDGVLSLTALVAHPDGSPHICENLSGPADNAAELGVAIAERLLANGARELLDSIEAGDD